MSTGDATEATLPEQPGASTASTVQGILDSLFGPSKRDIPSQGGSLGFTVTVGRHADSPSNHRPLEGEDFPINPGVTDLGEDQLKSLKNQILAELAAGTHQIPDVILCSPMIRTQLTAKAMQSAYQESGRKVPLVGMDKLCETWSSAEKITKDFDGLQLQDPTIRNRERAEKWKQKQTRASDCVRTFSEFASGIYARKEEDGSAPVIAVVTHSEFGQWLLHRLREGEPESEFSSIENNVLKTCTQRDFEMKLTYGADDTEAPTLSIVSWKPSSLNDEILRVTAASIAEQSAKDTADSVS